MRAILVALFASCGFATAAESPVAVSLCDVQAHPEKYDRQLVKIKGTTVATFESFVLFDPSCPSSSNSVWLTFGGDVSDPVVYCCGDHSRRPGSTLKVQGLRIPLLRNDNFRRFMSLIRTYGGPTLGSRDKEERPYFEVTATLTGRFFRGAQTGIPGYGHLGCCSLLAIEEVNNINSVIKIAHDGDQKCVSDSWQYSRSLPELKRNIRQLQRRSSKPQERWRRTDYQRVAREALQRAGTAWEINIPDTNLACRLDEHNSPTPDPYAQYEAVCLVQHDGVGFGVGVSKPAFMFGAKKDWEEIVWYAGNARREICTQ
jgi:hypothetical protein